MRVHGGKLVDRTLSGKLRERRLEEAKELPSVQIPKALADDLENIGRGVFSPLEGFLCQDDYLHVLKEKRLSTDLPWPIPIIFHATHEEVKLIQEGDELVLRTDKPLALLQVEEKYRYDKKELAVAVYGTSDTRHPGVAKSHQQGEWLLGGELTLLNSACKSFITYTLWPKETRILFKEKGWHTVVGFQTRNPPHLGHEYIQKTALTFVDGIFINPIIGKKKSGDFRDTVILKAYDELIKHYYLRERAVLSILRTAMRYAGPREAVFHAIIRKNFGCTHFIMGRDHAGVGNYYPPFAAQEIFDEFPDLGIIPLFFKSFFYCKRCGSVVNEKTCPHTQKHHLNFSGTRIREMLNKGEPPPKLMMRPEVARLILREKKPFVE